MGLQHKKTVAAFDILSNLKTIVVFILSACM